MTRILSPQQEVVRNFPRTHTGSAFAEAVAGAGKTTTAMYMIAETEGTVGVMAYNKSAALEFDHKARELGFSFGNRVRFGTCHSFGFGAWRYVHKNVKAGPEAARQKTDDMFVKFQIPKTLQSFTAKLIDLAKQNAIGLYGAITDEKLYYDIIEHHDLDHEIEDPGLIKAGVQYAIDGLKWHIEMGPELIDFSDMIYLPVVTGIKMFGNDWIVGDEWQDANPARRALARKMLKPNGRALFIGDRHQAIYGWVGADAQSIDNTIKQFNCIELPMTVTFRCPKAVVARAQTVVSHIEAHESAPEGRVLTFDEQQFWSIGGDPVVQMDKIGTITDFDQVNDAILCRNTKPLVSTAFQLIKRGIPCHVEGRDIGAGLIKLIERFKSAKTMTALRDRMTAYRDQQMQKLLAKGKETQAQSIEDKVDTVLVIADACQSVDELKAKIASMFQDSEGERKPTLTLSTVHKSKGREWQRVFLMGENIYMPSPYARQEWQLEQERNLQYVAYTRAKSELVLVNMERI
jgi:DNA helicase II / ATP-dependent DNA helicase PcrA